MIQAHYRRDGTLEFMTLDYRAAAPADQRGLVLWIQAHRIDPARVPTLAKIGYDPATNEWIFPVQHQPARLDQHGDVILTRVRRKVVELV